VDKLVAQGIKVIWQENKGVAAARKVGILASQGENLFPLDADDRLRSGWIDPGSGILDSDPQVDVVYEDAECFGIRTGRWHLSPFDPDRLLHANYIRCSALYRRSVCEQNDGYDGTMPVQGTEYSDFWLGTLENGWQFTYVPEILFDYRIAAQSMLTRLYGSGLTEQVEAFLATKHGLLYRHAWLSLLSEGQSARAVSRRLVALFASRVERKSRK